MYIQHVHMYMCVYTHVYITIPVASTLALYILDILSRGRVPEKLTRFEPSRPSRVVRSKRRSEAGF